MRLNAVLDMPDGLWRVSQFLESPNLGLVVLDAVEPSRGVSICVPVSWVEALFAARGAHV